MDAVQSAQRVVILRAYPELNIPPAQGTARNLVRMRIRRTAPGRTQEYYEWMAKQLVPAIQGAGVRGVLFGRVILGDSPETWITISDEPSFAAMGTDVLAKSMGAAQSAQMLGRGMAMLVHTEDLVMHSRPDLGFVNETLQIHRRREARRWLARMITRISDCGVLLVTGGSQWQSHVPSRKVTAPETTTGSRYEASTAANGGYTIQVPQGATASRWSSGPVRCSRRNRIQHPSPTAISIQVATS
jgi:hypothetical protein